MNYGYCTVYAIGPIGGSVIKIGIAANVGRRLRQLQHASAETLVIYHSRTFTKRVIAAQVEARAHEFLKDQRRLGEWFAATPVEVEAAIEAAVVWVRNRRAEIPDMALRRFVHLRKDRA